MMKVDENEEKCLWNGKIVGIGYDSIRTVRYEDEIWTHFINAQRIKGFLV